MSVGDGVFLSPEAGWSPVTPLGALGPIRSFVSGDESGDRLRVRYYMREMDRALVGKVWFGPGAEGPPGHAHGGSMAAVLDEAMGAAAWMVGCPVVARSITTKFLAMLPLQHVVIVETRITHAEGRRVLIEGFIADATGSRFATGFGVFIKLSVDRLRALRASPS
jgi:hypothetical protein